MSASAIEGWFEDRLGSGPRLPTDAVILEFSRRAELAGQLAHPSVRRLSMVGRGRAGLDADLLEATVSTVAACREACLARKEWQGVDLNVTKTRTLDAETKRAAITEVQAALGFTTTEATTLVGLAMGPTEVLTEVVGALRRAETSWAQVRRFWDVAGSGGRGLSADQQLLVASSLFGTDETVAAAERLDPEGELVLGEPWPQAAFQAALVREVTACEGSDVAAERARRRRARRDRRARVRVHDNGTATMILTGPAVPVVGAWARFDHVARTMRAQGAEEPLEALAVDAMLAVLGHGTLDLPDPGTLVELSDEQLDHLIAVVTGMPRIAMQVVVPVDVLGLGHPVCASCATNLAPTDQLNASATTTSADDSSATDHHATHGPVDGSPADGSPVDGSPADDDVAGHEGGSLDSDECVDGDLTRFDRSAPPPDWARPDPAPDAPHASEPPGAPSTETSVSSEPTPAASHTPGRHSPDGPRESSAFPPSGGQTWGHDPDLRHGRGLVGEVLGSHPFFITPGQARELFYTPGTTLHRVLTDPADGRCVERTITTYRPDADMRRQVNAADVYSRAPWARLTGRSLEIDHVIPYGTDPGGVTCELNLGDLDKRTHKTKTLGILALSINERRDLTFTTLLGQITRTRTHDYRQYLHALHPEDLDERRDLADRAVYAALAARPEHRRRPGKDTWLTLDHTDADGQRHPGPPEQPEDLDRLLGITEPESGDASA